MRFFANTSKTGVIGIVFVNTIGASAIAFVWLTVRHEYGNLAVRHTAGGATKFEVTPRSAAS